MAAIYDEQWLVENTNIYPEQSEDVIQTTERSLEEVDEIGLLEKAITSLTYNILNEGKNHLCAVAEQLPWADSCAPIGRVMSCVVDGLKDIAVQAVKFEAQLALDSGMVSGDDSASLNAALQRLYDEPSYVSYLHAKYPLLRRQIRRRARALIEANSLLFERLALDLREICLTLLGCSTELAISGIVTNAGDSHHSGASVCIIHFFDGSSVVYKPRSVDAEARFQLYLDWFNTAHAAFKLKKIKLIDRETYGWAEYVPHAVALNDAEVEAYYERYGALLALIYSINGTDIHHENLIASGEHPVIIDLETILQPLRYNSEGNATKHFVMDLEFLANSVFFTGMLPTPSLVRGKNNTPTTGAVRSLKRIDELKVSPLRVVVEQYCHTTLSETHILMRNGFPVPIDRHAIRVARGFRSACEALVGNKLRLIDSLVDEFFGTARVRVVTRYTRWYKEILNASYSAYAQTGFAAHDEFTSKLWNISNKNGIQGRMVCSEVDQLTTGDIPFFMTDVDSTSLVDCGGNEFADMLWRSGLDSTKEKLAGMSPQSIERDGRLIVFALENARVAGAGRVVVPSEYASLFDCIKKYVQWNDGRGDVADITTSWNRTTEIGLLSNDLYVGLPGIALAVAYHEHQFEEKEQIGVSLAKQCLDDFDSGRLQRLGVCYGVGGLVYVAAHMATLSNKSYFLRQAGRIASYIQELVWTDKHFDVFSGSAGALFGLLALESANQDSCMGPMRAVVKHLLDHAQWAGNSVSWDSPIPSDGPTTGFAHGVSGIGLALLRAYRVLGESDILEAVMGCDQFLRKCVVYGTGLWAEDEVSNSGSLVSAWCHGAPGITLFYHELAKLTQDTFHTKAFMNGLDGIIAGYCSDNDSLCHGRLGNIDLLITLANNGNCNGRATEISEVLSTVSAHLIDKSPVCGTKNRYHSLGLYTGLSGIAYQRMRLASVCRLPSFLSFDGPVRS